MNSFKLCTVGALTAFTLGCTKGVPNFSTLDSGDIPQPMFSGSTQETLNASSSSETFLVSGDCDPKIRDITGAVVGTATTFSTLTTLATAAVDIECASTGHFSFTLKSLGNLGISPQNAHIYDIQLRGITSGGISNPSTIHIAFSSTGGPDPKHLTLTSGSTTSTTSGPRLTTTGAVYKAQIRVTTRSTTDKSGSQYKMKAGVSAQAD